jgi:serine/threonine protein kinase
MCFNYKPRDALSSNLRRFSAVSSYEGRQYITAGGSGLIYGIDKKRVVKQYFEGEERDGERERRAYARLGSHPNIASYLGSLKDGSIILERGQPLREKYQKSSANKIPLRRKLRWLRQAAEGIRYAHEKDIVQADVGCYNMILTRACGPTVLMGSDCLKLIDFAGASIEGGEHGSRYQWYNYRRSTPEVSKQTDIFAFGCVIYEIVTGRYPYHEFEASDNRSHLVEQLYQEKQFPDLTNLPLGQLMQGCWHGTFNSMSEVVQALEAADSMSMKAKGGATATKILKSCCFFIRSICLEK